MYDPVSPLDAAERVRAHSLPRNQAVIRAPGYEQEQRPKSRRYTTAGVYPASVEIWQIAAISCGSINGSNRAAERSLATENLRRKHRLITADKS